ncbi:MAG: hypothetical protein WDA23_11595 [Gemmobacter sp.]
MMVSWLAGGLAGIGLQGFLDGSMVLLQFAVLSMPITLPSALVIWVLARVVCWKAGLGEHAAAMLSRFLAGVGAMTIPGLMFGNPANVIPGVLLLGIPAGISGLMAAAIIYWDGWKKMASGD